MPPPPADLMSGLRELSLALERSRAAFVRRNDLVGNDSVILSHLISAGGRLLPREIARLMDLRTGTVTAMLDRLERCDFIERKPNPDDRRSTFIDLTPVGRDALEGRQHELEHELNSAFPVADRAAVTEQLERIAAAIDRAVESADAAGSPRRASS